MVYYGLKIAFRKNNHGRKITPGNSGRVMKK